MTRLTLCVPLTKPEVMRASPGSRVISAFDGDTTHDENSPCNLNGLLDHITDKRVSSLF